MKIDAEQGLLIVKGSIPGAPGTTVQVKTSVKKKSKGVKHEYEVNSGSIKWIQRYHDSC